MAEPQNMVVPLLQQLRLSIEALDGKVDSRFDRVEERIKALERRIKELEGHR